MITYLTKIISELFGPYVEKGIIKGVQGAADQIFRRGPKGFRYAALVFLATCCYFGYRWVKHTNDIQALFRSAIGNEFEPTPQRHKGIEVLTLPNRTAEMKQILRSKPNNEFIAQFTELEQAFTSNIDLRAPLALKKVMSRTNNDFYLTSADDGNSFLFIPGNILSVRKEEENLEGAIKKFHPDLYEDILRTNKVSSVLSKFREAKLFREQSDPLKANCLQSYIITGNGVLRINQVGDNVNQYAYYEKKFKMHEFFPSRPYFWPAVEKGKKSGYTNDSIEDYFYASNLYFDLGGNGIVLTLCRSLGKPSDNCVACFDYGFINELKADIQKRLGVLGQVYEIKISRDGNVEPVGEPQLPAGADGYISNMVNTHSDWEQLFEQITKVDNPHAQAFTIPLPQQGRQVNHLLYCELDMSEVSKSSLIFAGGAVGSALLILVCIVFLLADYGYRHKREEEAFEVLDTAMSESTLPYFRLDKEDKIIEMNAAFWKLLGYQNEQHAKLNLEGKRFRDMIDKRSLAKYDEVQTKNKRREKADTHYTLDIKRVDKNPPVQVEIYRGASNVPNLVQGDLPMTFGVLVKKEIEEMILEDVP